MANTATVQAIITNLETLLTNAGFTLEDLSNDNLSNTPNAVIEYSREEFEENRGQTNKYNTIFFNILIQFKETTTAAARDKIATYTHYVRDNVNVNAVNVGDLSSSQLVSFVDHISMESENNIPIFSLSYQLSIRYRET